MYDFTTLIFTVPMRDTEVANSKTEIHLTNTTSEVMWACKVATIEHEGDYTSLLGICYYVLLGICYYVW